ncbi:hypothetical protein PR048_014071 [Dryococelus australis]|uniref:Uncharacterized protein n=1 Tax=Dryococelus australis TaxID=614101 RepID=A0ABQ9HTZ9_9NEOP|nr:hypothetical protein PR048_014071 [Dryococelus australis]
MDQTLNQVGYEVLRAQAMDEFAQNEQMACESRQSIASFSAAHAMMMPPGGCCATVCMHGYLPAAPGRHLSRSLRG